MLAILLVSCAVKTAAQQPSSSNTLAAEAGAAYDVKDWAKAARLYAELSQSPEAPPRVWLRLGAALRQLGKYEEALAAFEKANAAGAALFGEYGEAAVYTAIKQPEIPPHYHARSHSRVCSASAVQR
jgi:tetratricopeptide (TPR) repeat protein